MSQVLVDGASSPHFKLDESKSSWLSVHGGQSIKTSLFLTSLARELSSAQQTLPGCPLSGRTSELWPSTGRLGN